MKVALQLCWEEKAEKTEPKILIEREEFLDDPIEFRRKKRKRKKRIEKRKMEKKKKKKKENREKARDLDDPCFAWETVICVQSRDTRALKNFI